MTYFLKQQVTALGGLKVTLLSAETVSLESKVPGLVPQLAVWSTKHFDHVCPFGVDGCLRLNGLKFLRKLLYQFLKLDSFFGSLW